MALEQIKEEIRKQEKRQMRALQEQTKAIHKTPTWYLYNSWLQPWINPFARQTSNSSFKQ